MKPPFLSTNRLSVQQKSKPCENDLLQFRNPFSFDLTIALATCIHQKMVNVCHINTNATFETKDDLLPFSFLWCFSTRGVLCYVILEAFDIHQKQIA